MLIEKISSLFYKRSFIYLWGITIYLPIILRKKQFDIDFDLVLKPLYGVTSLSQYFDLFLSKHLFDIQPVRDLTLLIDIQLESILKHQTFNLTNVLIWCSTILILDRILSKMTTPFNSRLLALIVLSHPLLSWTLSWPTARKHLLSVFFITWVTKKIIDQPKNNKDIFRICILYLLSLLSQPISSLAIIPALLFSKKKLPKEKFNRLSIMMISLFLAVVCSNFYYYKFVYPTYSGTAKIMEMNLHLFVMQVFSFSRSLTQIILPISFSQTYNPRTYLSFIGMPFFIISFYLIYLKYDWKKSLFFALFVFYPFILILARPTNIFVSDTYIIISLANIFIVIGYILKNKKISFLFLVLPILLSFKSILETKQTTSPYAIFKTSFEREPNCKNAHSYANELLKENLQKDFMQISGDALKNKCAILGKSGTAIMNQNFAFRIVLDKSFTLQEKLRILNKMRYVTPQIEFLKAILLHKAGKVNSSQLLLSKVESRIQPEMKQILRSVSHQVCENLNCPRP